MSDDEKPLDPAAEAIVQKVRRLMVFAMATTFLAAAVVLMVVGYRIFKSGESAAPQTALQEPTPWPRGARVVSTAIGDGQFAITIEAGDGLEVRFFDLKTQKALGRMRLDGTP